MVVANRKKIDTQQVEIIGRNLLVSCCIADGVEVSLPMRDRGIDVIVFDDMCENGRFKALPVQLKSSSDRSFSVHKKYDKFPNLLMAYVWLAADPTDATLFIMTYLEAREIADKLGWTNTDSWITGGGYSTQSPSKRVMDELERYRYRPGLISDMIKL